jgi:hypothetical protein
LFDRRREISRLMRRLSGAFRAQAEAAEKIWKNQKAEEDARSPSVAGYARLEEQV